MTVIRLAYKNKLDRSIDLNINIFCTKQPYAAGWPVREHAVQGDDDRAELLRVLRLALPGETIF